jgi:cation diffusion facilitator family transporter
MADSSSLRAVLYALGANFGIFVAKSAATVVTGSSAMLAEAIHSLADCGNQVLLLRGIREAKRPPDSEHPLGYGRVAYFWAFLVAVMLFTLGGMFSIYEGYHKLHAPEPMTRPWIAISVLIVGIALEGFSLFAAIGVVRKIAHGRGLWNFFRTSRNSDLVVILGEDTAAIAGLSIALVAVILAVVTGNPLFDALGSIAVGVLLVIVAWLLSIEIKSLITGQSAEPHVDAGIRELIASQPEVIEVFNVITLQLGGDVLVAAKARVRAPVPGARQLVEAINGVEAKIKTDFPVVRWVFFEPDITD